MAVNPWLACPTYSVNLDDSMERRFAGMPPDLLAKVRSLLRELTAWIPHETRYLADAVRVLTEHRFHHEVVTLADILGVDWRDLMLANLAYDLRASRYGCSTIALATSDGPVLARNMDWMPPDLLARASCLVTFTRNGEIAFTNAGWLGATGIVTGMGRGFAVVLNAVFSAEQGRRRKGFPVLLHLRRVVEDAVSFDHALAMLDSQELATSALFTLVGVENRQRVVVERSPTKCALRYPEGDAALLATNDYRLLAKPMPNDSSEIFRTTCSRYEHLSTTFNEHDANREVRDAELLYLLTDENVIQSCTAQHVVMRPAQGSIKLFVPRRLMAGEGRGA